MSKQKTLLVVDGQGGGLGKNIIEKVRKAGINLHIIAVGANALATAAMLKAGADEAATGENAVVYNSQFAHYIMGGVGVIAANSMLGEVTPAMAGAVASANALKLLIPVNRCLLFVAGVKDNGLGEKIDEAIAKIAESLEKN